ncbi:MAG TPA: lysine--tRNA ligase, partial [Myxococcaceae bacterium]|nr:lysine--tRNA ligase [Myxococcaceae bacterium]
MAETQENKTAEVDLGSKEQEIYAQRQEKAQKWREAGFNPYGNGYRPEHLAADIHARPGQQSPEEL